MFQFKTDLRIQKKQFNADIPVATPMTQSKWLKDVTFVLLRIISWFLFVLLY